MRSLAAHRQEVKLIRIVIYRVRLITGRFFIELFWWLCPVYNGHLLSITEYKKVR